MAARWGHPLGVALAALGLLVAGSQLQGWLPSDDDDPGSDPHLRTGSVGDPIDIRTATVTVERVTGSRTIDEYGTEMVSPGVWVVVSYTVVAHQENTMITSAELEDAAGRVWKLHGRNTNACTASPPDLPAHCTVRFEVPPDALTSLRLRLARVANETRYDVVAEVDLGLTADDADEFVDAGPIEIPGASLGEEETS